MPDLFANDANEKQKRRINFVNRKKIKTDFNVRKIQLHKALKPEYISGFLFLERYIGSQDIPEERVMGKNKIQSFESQESYISPNL